MDQDIKDAIGQAIIAVIGIVGIALMGVGWVLSKAEEWIGKNS